MQKVAELQELPDGAGTVVEVDGESVAVFRMGKACYAVDNTCPHSGGPLGEGRLEVEDGRVICPWHAWEFDVRTGECVSMPGCFVRTYPVMVRDGAVFVTRGGA